MKTAFQQSLCITFCLIYEYYAFEAMKKSMYVPSEAITEHKL